MMESRDFLEDFYEHYTDWSREQIEVIDTLLAQPFIVAVEGDENRVDDVVARRPEWMAAHFISCLEILAVMADELAFQTAGSLDEKTEYGWFWELLGNLGIETVEDVADGCTRFVHREYDAMCNGGLFPSKYYKRSEDARELDLWYQMQVYLRGVHYS